MLPSILIIDDPNYFPSFQVYPDQSHSLPNVRQHQYIAMEDFFAAAFNAITTSISRNNAGAHMVFEMDNLLYANRTYIRQQKAKLQYAAFVRHKEKLKQLKH